MGSKTIVKLLKVVLPIAVFYILFRIHALLAFGTLFLAIAILVILKRASIYSYFGTVNYAKNKMEESLKWFKKSYDTGKATPKSIASYSYLLLKTGNTDEADKVMTKLLKNPLDKESENYVKANHALVVWKKGDIDKAASMLEELITDYKNSTVYGSLGYLLILKGDMDKALQFNLEAYEYNSSNTVIMDNLGQIYYLTGNYEKSVEIFEALIQKKPTFPSAYYNYGLLLMKMDQLEKAQEMMQKARSFEFNYLSTVSKEEIDTRINEINEKLAISQEE